MYLFLGISIDVIVSFLFYRSIIAFIIFIPAIYIFIKKQKKRLVNSRKEELTLQFREAIIAVSAALASGYSIENAFFEATNDLISYFGKSSLIVKEFINITGRVSSNETIEAVLQDFADRSGIEEIQDFTDVFATAKRTGGDLIAIIRKTSEHISTRIDVKREINTVISSKKMEQNIMSVIPFLIILYLNFSSTGFMDSLYGNITGIVIMTICLGLYIISLYLAKKIITIEV